MCRHWLRLSADDDIAIVKNGNLPYRFRDTVAQPPKERRNIIAIIPTRARSPTDLFRRDRRRHAL